jgi:hypothetical protein
MMARLSLKSFIITFSKSQSQILYCHFCLVTTVPALQWQHHCLLSPIALRLNSTLSQCLHFDGSMMVDDWVATQQRAVSRPQGSTTAPMKLPNSSRGKPWNYGRSNIWLLLLLLFDCRILKSLVRRPNEGQAKSVWYLGTHANDG